MKNVDWWDGEVLAWTPPEKITVSDWADRTRILDAKTSAEPGPWRTSRTPYLREILDAFSSDDVEQITLMTSTQVGKTEVILNTVGYTIEQDPGPGILVLPREPDAERIIARRVKPMIEASPELERQKTGWKADYKASELSFARSVLYTGWAHSAASLAGNPCRYAWGDEIDKWPPFAGKEADPVDLMRERTRTFYGLRRLVLASTPTTRAGRIYKEYEGSDRRKYWVPCPHCHRYQTLEWAQVKIPKGERDHRKVLADGLAWYECVHCSERISNGDKLEILELGRWVAKEGEILDDGTVIEPEVPNINRGFHLWAGYSPWLTWSEIAAKFLEANNSNDPAKLMNFVNSWLGELWEETVENPTAEAVGACLSNYHEAEVPEEVVVLTAGVDVQKRELYVSVYGWGRDERCFLILEARLGRDFRNLEDLVIRGHFGGQGREKKLPVRLVAIDCRYRTAEVYEIARRHPNVRAVRGVERRDPLPYSVSKIDRHPVSGAVYRKSLVCLHLNVGLFKDKVASSIAVGPAPGKPRAFHIHDETSDDFRRQMGSEQKVIQRDRKGRAVERWVPAAGIAANHFWDTTVYAFAAAHVIHVPLLTSDQQEKRARRVRRRRGGPRRIGGNL